MVWLSVARRAYEVYDLCISSLIKAAADCLEKSWHVDIFTYSDVSPQQLTVSLSSEFLFRRKIFNDASSVKTVFLSKQWKCLWEVAASGCESKNSLVWFSIQDFFCDKFHESNPLKNINNWKEMSTEHVKKTTTTCSVECFSLSWVSTAVRSMFSDVLPIWLSVYCLSTVTSALLHDSVR